MCWSPTSNCLLSARSLSDWRSAVSIQLIITAMLTSASGCALFPAAASTIPGHSLSAKAAGEIDAKTQAEACRRTGMQLAAHERDEHAIAQLERARELDPNIKAISHPLAVLYDRQGRIDAAEREYLAALKETKNSPDVLNDYGYYLYCRDELARAEEALRDCLRQNEKHQMARLNLGMVLAKQGLNDGSFAEFEKAVGPSAAHHNVGLLLIRNGQREQGLEHLQLAAKTDPSLHSESILAQLQSPHENAQPESEWASHSRTDDGYSRTNHVKAGQLPK
jgi:Tfp pilus assembly protein PilF